MKEREHELLKFSDEWFLRRYFEYGSVEAAMKGEYLPTSVSNYHRLIKKYGIIGSAGRHTSLPEVLHFFKEIALAPNTPLEQMYREMPSSFKTSLMTLHRIYQHIESNIVRRYAVALFITEGDSESFLVGEERSSNTRYGKTTGALTIPMSFSKEHEGAVDSIFRVLQQEVSVDLAILGEFSTKSVLYQELSVQKPEPFMYLRIVDTQVAAYHIKLSQNIKSFNSHKLANHRFMDISTWENQGDVRLGVPELVRGFGNYINEFDVPVVEEVALLNQLIMLSPEVSPVSTL